MKKILFLLFIATLSCNTSSFKCNSSNSKNKPVNIEAGNGNSDADDQYYINPFSQPLTRGGAKTEVILELPKGAKVFISGMMNCRSNYNDQVGRWAEVTYKDIEGWIFVPGLEISKKNILYLKNFDNFTEGCLGDYGSGDGDSSTTLGTFFFKNDHTASCFDEGESFQDCKWKIDNNTLVVEGLYASIDNGCMDCEGHGEECLKKCKNKLMNVYGKTDNFFAKVTIRFYILENGQIKSVITPGKDPNPIENKKAMEFPSKHWMYNFIWGNMYKYRKPDWEN